MLTEHVVEKGGQDRGRLGTWLIHTKHIPLCALYELHVHFASICVVFVLNSHLSSNILHSKIHNVKKKV